MFLHRRSAVAFGLTIAFALAAPIPAQGTRQDYERSNELARTMARQLTRFQADIRWMPDGSGVHFDTIDDAGKPVHVVVGKDGKRRVVDPKSIGATTTRRPLSPKRRWGRSPRARAKTSIMFTNRLDRRVRIFWSDLNRRTQPFGAVAPGESKTIDTYVGHVWVTDFKADDLTGIFVAERAPGLAVIDAASRRRARPDGEATPRRRRAFRVSVENNDVYGTATDGNGKKFRLTSDGTVNRPYDRPRWWSPDNRFVLGTRSSKVEKRRIPVIDSAPKGQVQPKLKWYTYVKPGDDLAAPTLALFDLKAKRQIPVDAAPFADAYRIDRIHWAPDSSRVFCLYNQRGHGVLALRSIDTSSGKVTDIARDASKTFVDYSQKTYVHWLDDAHQVIWASERDGWNHLYRFDTRTGKLVNQITQGSWVVRKVERVDEKKRQIWFTALGIHKEQDPYHRHLARIDFDGKNLTVLTRSDGTHTWELSPDESLLISRWSRVDHPEVTELRSAADGSLIAELGRDDASKAIAAGFTHPERFVAKGRDGKTDIWGFILRPSKCDANKKYPILEHVYAGPHDHHVPKAFSSMRRLRRMAELGFIVVKIDGMGTNWRSKAFHDVCWQNLKDGGFPDRIAWMRAAAKEYPELDLTRVGIYGGSAGGQNALAALLHHGDFYKAAAADCGCHDNRMDKIWWNEAWMGRMGPHYANNSNVTHAANLKGKLFLTVGELDSNVDPASTMQVVDALIRADKDFDMIVAPGANHGIGEGAYLFRRRQDFFVRALWNAEPRRRH